MWSNLFKFLCLGAILPVTLPLYCTGVLVYGRPPIVRTMGFYIEALKRALTRNWGIKNDKPLPISARVKLVLYISCGIVRAPVVGNIWFIDEFFYGKNYRKVKVERPTFLISGARSGSTQIGHYIEEDSENFIAPMGIELMFPYMWVWRAFIFLGLHKILTKERVMTNLKKNINPEVLKRHNLDFFKTDTWEIIFLSSYCLMQFNHNLDLETALDYHNHRTLTPLNYQLWMDFVELNHLVLQKMIYLRGGDAKGRTDRQKRIPFVKGHFLNVGPELAKRYPKAKFMTSVRNPEDRFRSIANFLYCTTSALCKMEQVSMSPHFVEQVAQYAFIGESEYNDIELEFFKHLGPNGNTLAFSFQKYKKDLVGTMEQVYKHCGFSNGIPEKARNNLNAALESTHTKKRQARQQSYAEEFNQTLAQMGLNKDKINERNSLYIRTFQCEK